MLTQMNAPMEHYLLPSVWLDFHKPRLQQAAQQLVPAGMDELSVVKAVFEFVRDHIRHSYDHRLDKVTVTASDTLIEGHGICYAKSHLLAAMLRARGIPAGLCYQRLTLYDTADSGFCIHALNTVFIQSLQTWIRLDARGNKPGVNAQFSVDVEYLAFPVRTELGEIDYATNHAQPHSTIIQTLTSSSDSIAMYEHNLPTSLSDASQGSRKKD
jgi:transglutaminase-like putative cysteine protease